MKRTGLRSAPLGYTLILGGANKAASKENNGSNMIRALRSGYRRVYSVWVAVARLAPRLAARRIDVPSIRLGTAYGGWWIVEGMILEGETVLSAGAGEDISFDVEIARRFGARVILVDPTPRAIEHVRAVIDRLGAEPTAAFLPGGRQPPGAYDLKNVGPSQIRLVPSALWSDSGGICLYPPSILSHVSFSIKKSTGPLRQDAALRVSSVTVEGIVDEIGHEPTILKMDIEGAEVDALTAMLATRIRPKQVLVEFDVLVNPTLFNIWRACRTVRSLSRSGYRLFSAERLNYSFVLTTSA